MTFDEYIARYRMLLLSLENDERMNILLDDRNYISFMNKLNNAKSLSAEQKSMIMPYQNIKCRIDKYERLIMRYALRLAKACSLIDYQPVREYAILRYIYGISNDKIADSSFYSLRSIYRHASRARKELSENLLKVMPRPLHLTDKKFRPSHKIRIRDYSISDELARTLAISHPTAVKAFRIKEKLAEKTSA